MLLSGRRGHQACGTIGMLQFGRRPVSQATEDQAVEHAAQPFGESMARLSAEIRAMREEIFAKLDEHKQETAAGFARMEGQCSDLRQEMRAGFAEMCELIERSQRNTVIMLAGMFVLLLIWLEIRGGAVLALFGD